MAAIGTLPVLLATGIHSARPSASAVGKGGLYSCTTHSLVYQTDGSSWTTWATLGGTGLSDPMTTRGDVIVRNSSNTTARLGIGSSGTYLGSNGTDVSWSTPAGGSSITIPTYVQFATSTNSTTVTLGSAPTTGHRVILCVTGSNAATTAVACTNTTWTKMNEFTTGGSARISVWVGVVSGTGGTSITITNTATFVQASAVEVTYALTPTSTTFTGTTIAASNSTNYTPVGPFTPSASGNLVVIYQATDNAGNQPIGYPTTPYTPVAVVTGQRLMLAFSTNSMWTGNGWQSNGGIAWNEIT